MQPPVLIRQFEKSDAEQVRSLFVRINRLLAPAYLTDTFEAYIERSLREEIDRIESYYAEREGGFWVAAAGSHIVGMFGLERAKDDAMELRRMYVDPAHQRKGIARALLEFAESECRRRGVERLILSTSELQGAALSLYRASGFRLEREETAYSATNKTVGGGIRRYHFVKQLGIARPAEGSC